MDKYIIMKNKVSNWNINNVTNLSDMFSNCESLQSLPDISIWNTSKVNDISFIFYGCKLVNKLPDISKWNTSNITDKYKFFSNTVKPGAILQPILSATFSKKYRTFPSTIQFFKIMN